MPKGKLKLKTVSMTLRVEPRVKAAAEQAAKRVRRSVTNFIEVLTSRSKNKPIQILENLNTDPVSGEIRFYRSNEKPYGAFTSTNDNPHIGQIKGRPVPMIDIKVEP
eukprot:gene18675-26409_t